MTAKDEESIATPVGPRRRLLIFALLTLSTFAQSSWALVLLGSGGSHGVSLRTSGVKLVLHHDDENAEHHHLASSADQHHEAGKNPAEPDHVVAMASDPASLRLADRDGIDVTRAFLVVLWSCGTLVASTATVETTGFILPGPAPPHFSRSTTILRI